jgi:hypothetical protein
MSPRENAKRQRKIETRQCAGPLDLQNKIRDSYPTPAVAALRRGVSSLTWTAGESRAVLFLGKQIARKKRKQVSEIEQY